MLAINNSGQLRTMIHASMFGALTAIGAFIVIPVQPVPFTLQTFFTALAGALLGGRAGGMSQIVYVILGCIGLPVFAAGKAGVGVLFGPTGGYLIGFIIGAYVIGKIVDMKPQAGFVWIAMSILAGDLIIYSLGVLQLMLIAQISLVKALAAGAVPFLFPEIIKLLAASLLAGRLRGKIFQQSGGSQ